MTENVDTNQELTPDKMKEALAAKEKEIAEMKAAQDAERAAGEKRYKDLSDMVTRLASSPAPTPKKEEPVRPKWDEDPDAAANMLIEQKLSPLVSTYVNTETSRQMQEISKEEYFSEFSDEITSMISQASPDQRMKPGFAKAIYDYVVGKNFPKVYAKESEKRKKKENETAEFHETSSASATPRGTSGVKLSDDEKRVAAGLGMTNEDYAKWRDTPESLITERVKK